MASPDQPPTDSGRLEVLKRLLALIEADGIDASPVQEAFLRGVEYGLRARRGQPLDETPAEPPDR